MAPLVRPQSFLARVQKEPVLDFALHLTRIHHVEEGFMDEECRLKDIGDRYSRIVAKIWLTSHKPREAIRNGRGVLVRIELRVVRMNARSGLSRIRLVETIASGDY
jgi:hypothetical protein